MTLIILLFVTGILLLGAEVLVPGGILGVLGGLLLFGATVAVFVMHGTAYGVLAAMAAMILCLIMLFLELRVLPRSRLGRQAFLTSAVHGVSAAYDPESARSLTGKAATALTLLSPSGYVLVEGRRYEAFCQSGQAPVGADLEVVGADNFRLIVSQAKPL
ncbi:MAG: NfeD family protein [Akkermansiaceae bacterium]|jgi:membrane-bound serine protease (ClpP class)|nr:NfeD family protein [Akkermansiaceae bacterium]